MNFVLSRSDVPGENLLKDFSQLLKVSIECFPLIPDVSGRNRILYEEFCNLGTNLSFE